MEEVNKIIADKVTPYSVASDTVQAFVDLATQKASYHGFKGDQAKNFYDTVVQKFFVIMSLAMIELYVQEDKRLEAVKNIVESARIGFASSSMFRDDFKAVLDAI